jgi:4-amino-4-deoxy-L-arabinose transferase-like glycosyltransferase
MDKSEQFFRFTVLITGIAFITRLAVLLLFWYSWIWQSGNIHDDWNKLAINLVESGTYGFSPNESTVKRGPIFPLIEIPLYLLFGENYAAWSIGLLLFDSSTCLLLILFSRRLWGCRTALLAGFFYAIHLAVIYYVAQIEQFTTVLPLVFLWFYLFSFWDLKSSTKWLPWALGVVSGLLILNKAVYLPAPFVSSFAIIWFKRRETRAKKLIVPILIYLVVTVVMVAPWTYRNYNISRGKFIPVQSMFWSAFWQDILFYELNETKGLNRPAGETRQHILTTHSELFKNSENQYSGDLKGPQKELYEEKVFAKTTLKWICKNPSKTIKIKLNNVWEFWIGAENLNKTLLMLSMQIFYLGAAFVGFCLLLRYHQIHRIRFGLLLILLVWGEYFIVFAWGRYSLDFVPILGIIFGLGIDTWMKQAQLKEKVI